MVDDSVQMTTLCNEIASENVTVDLTKGETLNGTNYSIWHKKIQYLLNEVEILTTITNII